MVHIIGRDPIDPSEERKESLRLEIIELRNTELARVARELRKAKIETRRFTKTLRGNYKGEPFAIFVNILGAGMSDGEAKIVGHEIVTRYKGKDHRIPSLVEQFRAPLRALKG